MVQSLLALNLLPVTHTALTTAGHHLGRVLGKVYLDQVGSWACLCGIALIAFINSGRASLKVASTVSWLRVLDYIKSRESYLST